MGEQEEEEEYSADAVGHPRPHALAAAVEGPVGCLRHCAVPFDRDVTVGAASRAGRPLFARQAIGLGDGVAHGSPVRNRTGSVTGWYAAGWAARSTPAHGSAAVRRRSAGPGGPRRSGSSSSSVSDDQLREATRSHAARAHRLALGPVACQVRDAVPQRPRRRRGRTAARSASGRPGPAGRRGPVPRPAARWPPPPGGSGRRSRACPCGRTGRTRHTPGRGRRPPADRGRRRRCPPRRGSPRSSARLGPSPTTATRRFGRPRRAASRCSSFSGARRPDVAHHDLAARGERPAQRPGARVGAPARVEQRGVHAASPQRGPGDAVRVELGQGRRRRRQGEVGHAVDPSHPAPRGPGGSTAERPPGVLAQVARHVGLVDRHAWVRPVAARPTALPRRGRTARRRARRPARRPPGRTPPRPTAGRRGTGARGPTPGRARHTRRSCVGAGRGARITASCPLARRHSATRHTLVVTPLRLGRNDSVTIATRTIPSVGWPA